MKVKAVQKFYAWGGRLVLKDEEIDVDESLGREVINSGKAVLVQEEVASAAAATKQEDAPAG